MQMALSDDGPASIAVLNSMLALASLHREGNLAHAARLKLSALQALMISSKRGISSMAGIQHIAAGILLCTFEVGANPSSCYVELISHLQVQQTSENSSQWIGHICGAKDVIKAVQEESHAPGSDSSIILGWVYYCDVLARFCLRHWRTPMVKHTANALGFDPTKSRDCAIQYLIARTSFSWTIPNITNHCHPVLACLSEICDTLLYPWDPLYHADGYQYSLEKLQSNLMNMEITGPDPEPSPQPPLESVGQILELFRLAGLVYLERASKNFSGQSTELNQWAEKAFSIFSELQYCRHPFPIFIFGCEAHDDDRRMVILDLITRTEQHPHIRNLQDTRELLQSAWIHEDLEVDREVEYIRKLNLVLSSSDVVPSFM
ncbi:MAG: hypothetical protein Q9227_000939 [Pyrenula ochraceoflavens]